MSRIRATLHRLRGMFADETGDRELSEELASHLELHIDDNIRAGMSPDEARRDALIKLGGVEQTKERYRDRRGLPWLETLIRDLRFGLRMIRRNRGAAAAVVISIGLAIAANATIFSMVSTFLLQHAQVADPAAAVNIYGTQHHECCNDLSWPLFTDLRDHTRSFAAVAAYYALLPASIGGKGEPERVWGQSATADFFEVARFPMTLGRAFKHDEEHAPVVVLGHGLWQRRFGSDPTIAGKSILLSGRPFTVIGVTPGSFHGFDLLVNAEFWVPLGNLDGLLPKTANFESRSYSWLPVVARLKPGVTRAQAAAELTVLGEQLARAFPVDEKARGFRVEPAGSLPPKFKTTMTVFLAALTVVVILVLCIACANVANLLLAQASTRQREMAVRLALGATPGQLLRQMLAESVLLSVVGGVLGLLLSLLATRGLESFHLPVPVPLDLRLSIDWKVILYTSLLSVGTGVLFGLAPALAAARSDLSAALKGADFVGRPGRRISLRSTLVVLQIGISMILLCATGLFLRSLQSASSIDLGFRPRNVLMLSIDPQAHGYTPERTAQLLTRLQQRLAALPGVTSMAATDLAPLSIGGRRDAFHVDGRSASDRDPNVDLYMITPGYFDTLGIVQLAGRDIGTEDLSAPRVAVINEELAQLLFKQESPIGQRVTGAGETYQVIGVVKSSKSRTLGEKRIPVLYRSLVQETGREASFMGYTLLIHTRGEPMALAAQVRREIDALDPTLAIFNLQTMDQHLRDALFLPRLAGTLFLVFGAIGLILAAVGLYGVMSYSVSQRTRELGIRMALGAQVGEIQRLIIRQGMLLTFIAIVPGLLAALAVARLATSVLYGVEPHDTVTFVSVPLFLTAVAFLACWIPARRATRVDPMGALRHE